MHAAVLICAVQKQHAGRETIHEGLQPKPWGIADIPMPPNDVLLASKTNTWIPARSVNVMSSHVGFQGPPMTMPHLSL